MSRWANRRVELSVLFALAGCLLVLSLPLYRYSAFSVDPMTGSTKRVTYWVETKVVIRQSALEKWLVAHEGSYVSRWQRISESTSTWYGTDVARGGYREPPAIYWLKAGEQNDAFVRSSSDAHLAEFVRVMRAGTTDEKQKAVESAAAIANNQL